MIKSPLRVAILALSCVVMWNVISLRAHPVLADMGFSQQYLTGPFGAAGSLLSLLADEEIRFMGLLTLGDPVLLVAAGGLLVLLPWLLISGIGIMWARSRRA